MSVSLLRKNQVLFPIFNTNNLTVVAYYGSRDFNRISLGDNATVSSDSISGEFKGQVTALTPVGRIQLQGEPYPSSDGALLNVKDIFPVFITLEKNSLLDKLIKPGMLMNVSIKIKDDAHDK